MRDTIQPILENHRVNFYMNGHVHLLEHIVPPSKDQRHTVHYLTSGAAHGVQLPDNTAKASTERQQWVREAETYKRFVFPQNFTKDEAKPNEEAWPRTIPDAGHMRGGFFSMQFTPGCACLQAWGEDSQPLYRTSIPNTRPEHHPAHDDPEAHCTELCAPFTALDGPLREVTVWLIGGAIAALVVGAILMFALRWYFDRRRGRALSLLNTKLLGRDSSFNEIDSEDVEMGDRSDAYVGVDDSEMVDLADAYIGDADAGEAGVGAGEGDSDAGESDVDAGVGDVDAGEGDADVCEEVEEDA
jgi:hypothetical protein